jgi:hypothetical protein
MKKLTEDSSSYENPSELDPIEALLREICTVFANGASFCARLIVVRNESELWFESKSGLKWMVQRQAAIGIQPLHHAPVRRE